MYLYIVPEEIVTAMDGARKEDAALDFIRDIEGRALVNRRVRFDWPEIDWASMAIVDVNDVVFPPPLVPEPLVE